jgi:hypothetical protein
MSMGNTTITAPGVLILAMSGFGVGFGATVRIGRLGVSS